MENLSTQDPGTGIERAMFADRQGSVLYVTSPVGTVALNRKTLV
ncbi:MULTISPECIES: hypothetical protein [Rhodobacterales]|nr:MULTISPECIES: hypothetical protein [Rhodobacterales]